MTWNVAGQLLPLVAAVAVVPILVDEVGVERFGIITLAWAVVGYFGLFDLGIGRATTHYVAMHTAEGGLDRLPRVVWGSILLLGLIGTGLAVVCAAASPMLVDHVFNISPRLRGEATGAFLLLSAALPVILATAGARGALEGQQRFALVNAVKLPANLLLFVSPVVVLPLSRSLVAIVLALVVTRAAAFGVYLAYCLRAVPLPRGRPLAIGLPREVLRFGGWSALTNILGALMVNGYVDRFLIGSLLSVTAVAYYATPFEVITRAWIVPVAVLGVLFPAFSALAATASPRIRDLHWRAVKYVLLTVGPLAFVVVALAEPALDLWLGERFAEESTEVLQLLALGVLANSVAQVPFAALQALGRPDLTAKRHALQLPLYVPGIAIAAETGGVVGVAAGWLAWTLIDAAMLFWLLRRVSPETSRLPQGFAVALAIGPALALGYALSVAFDPAARLAAIVLGAVAFTVVTWRHLLDDAERRLAARALAGAGRSVFRNGSRRSGEAAR